MSDDQTASQAAASTSIGRLGVVWTVVLVLYSVGRALLVAPTLGPYGINSWVFLALDAGSAFPLASGQVRLVLALRRRDAGMVQRWTAVVAVAFLAPYVYLLLGAGRPLAALAYSRIQRCRVDRTHGTRCERACLPTTTRAGIPARGGYPIS